MEEARCARRSQPFRHALWLAVLFAVMMVMTGTPSLWETFTGRNLSREALAFAAMLAPGAFLASLPERIRRRGAPVLHTTWQGCLLMLAAGAALTFSAALAGGGDVRMLAGSMQGSVGALAFVGIAWLTALIAGRIADRRHP